MDLSLKIFKLSGSFANYILCMCVIFLSVLLPGGIFQVVWTVSTLRYVAQRYVLLDVKANVTVKDKIECLKHADLEAVVTII